MLLVDAQLGEQPASDRREHRVDGFRAGCRGASIAPPGAFIMASGGPQPLDHGAEDFARVSPRTLTRTESLSRFSNRPAVRAQLTWSNRTKKSASSAMMSG